MDIQIEYVAYWDGQNKSGAIGEIVEIYVAAKHMVLRIVPLRLDI
jgi:hypothetical protein